MGLFDAEETSVFKDETALYPDYLPNSVPHREGQIKDIADSIKPVLRGRKPQNVFIYGSPGTGKTTAVKYIFSELEKTTNRALPIYINCWMHNTRHAVLAMIANKMDVPVPRRGIATNEIYLRFFKKIETEKKIILVALDEVDQLQMRGELSPLLYDLLRTNEALGANIGVISITNDASMTSRLDARVRSSLSENEVAFSSYKPSELKDILKERAKLAFRDDALGKDVIPVCAAHGAKHGGDARIAIECLLKAGRAADRKGYGAVGVEHVKGIIDELGDVHMVNAIKSLSQEERKLLKVICEMEKEKMEMHSGALFNEYQKRAEEPVSERAFRNYVSRLDVLGVIDASLTGAGVRGKTRDIRLKATKQTLKEGLDEGDPDSGKE